jgi:membrane protease YdiL (CAAX protease family)
MSRSGGILMSSVVFIYSLGAFIPALRPAAAFCALLALIIVFAGQGREAVLPAMLVLLMLAVPLLHPLLTHWPWGLLAPFAVFLALVLPFRGLRTRLQWFRSGRIDRTAALHIAATILISAAALVCWERIARPDLSLHLASIPAMPAWLVPFAALGFSAGNAALEEFLFRGAIMEATDSAYGPGLTSLLAQAWVFGAAHFLRGFPNGWWGVALAALYGVMLGLLRRRSGGLLAPWAAHVGADLTVFCILAAQAAR